MNLHWTERNKIVANLFNPAFCGEIIRTVAKEYNKNSTSLFPFEFTFLILPIILHSETRHRMPRTTRSYFFVWVEENDDLFFDFPKRTRGMVKYTKESISFLLLHKKISLDNNGRILTSSDKTRLIKNDDYLEYNEILKKSEMLGKWLSATTDVRSIYSFLRITP